MQLKFILLFLVTGLCLTAQTHVDSIINKLNNPNLNEVDRKSTRLNSSHRT